MERLLEEAWKRFASAVMPANASWAQRVGMKCSFYAGARELWDVILKADDLGEDETMRVFSQIDKELVDFGNDVKAGRVEG